MAASFQLLVELEGQRVTQGETLFIIDQVPYQAALEVAKCLPQTMNYFYKYPSENRMEFTKLKVACKYASIERGCACH